MKVLLMSPLPPPEGGIASWTLNMLEYSAQGLTRFEIIQQDTGLKYRNIFKNDLFSRIFIGIREAVRIFRALKINVKEFSPDVIHLTSSLSLAIIKDYFILRIARMNKIPLIIHWHAGEIPSLSLLGNWEWKLLGHVIRGSHTSIVIDPKSYFDLLNRGFGNIVYIPNPIGLALEDKIRNLAFGDNHLPRNRLIFVGHLIEKKGVFELVEASSGILLVEELIMVGSYEETMKNELSKLAAKREKKDWLKFYGVLNNDQVLEQVRRSSIVVLPSYTEGFPIIVLESMAMARCVVASDVGAIPEMLAVTSEKPCGICIPARNVEKLRAAILSLLQNPEKARVMGNNGIERVLKNYTLNKVMENYKTVWDKACSG
jgi:glycosyltransferase involved in cell wall biosynthesis